MGTATPDWSKRYITEEGAVRTLQEMMELCSEDGSCADDPSLAIWCFGAVPEDGVPDPAIADSGFHA